MTARTDRTVTERVARYTAAMRSKGMIRVHVWVPTLADAAEIRQRAAEMRAVAQADPP
jgi:hypothetical protein